MTESKKEEIRTAVTEKEKDINLVIQESNTIFIEILKGILKIAESSPYENQIAYDTGIKITKKSTSRERMIARVVSGLLSELGFSTSLTESGNNTLYCFTSVKKIIELGKYLKFGNISKSTADLITEEIKQEFIRVERILTPLYNEIDTSAETIYNSVWTDVLTLYRIDPYQEKITISREFNESDAKEQRIRSRVIILLNDDRFVITRVFPEDSFTITTDNIRNFARTKVPNGTNKGGNNNE